MGRPKKNTVVAAEPIANDAVVVEQFQLSDDEKAAILALRQNKTSTKAEPTVGLSELAQALVSAIETTRPNQKKSIMDRKKLNPWTPKDGSPKITSFKRPMYHHSLLIDPKTTYNEDCLLLDKVRPGKYVNGIVSVTKRRDGGLDIDYPIRTNAQRLKFLGLLDKRSFNGLLSQIVKEGEEKRKRIRERTAEDDMD